MLSIPSISDIVADMLKDATEEELKNIIENGPQLEDDDMREAFERAYYEQALEKLGLSDDD